MEMWYIHLVKYYIINTNDFFFQILVVIWENANILLSENSSTRKLYKL